MLTTLPSQDNWFQFSYTQMNNCTNFRDIT